MFKFLKEKIAKWTKNLVKDKAEEIVETKREKPIKEKKQKTKNPEKIKPTKQEEKIKEIEVPVKFNAAIDQFQPDLEKIQEINNKIKNSS